MKAEKYEKIRQVSEQTGIPISVIRNMKGVRTLKMGKGGASPRLWNVNDVEAKIREMREIISGE